MEESDPEIQTDEFFLPGYKDAAGFTQDTLRSVLVATKASNDLPTPGDSYDYYSTFPGFRSVMLRKGQSILSLMTALVQNQGVREKFQGRELEEKYDLLVEVNDAILENVSNFLDEASGLRKNDDELILAVKPLSSINTSWNKKQFNQASSPTSYKLLSSKNITRPQLSFKDKIDNSNSVFVPIIKEKPNSIKPLAITLEKSEEREEFCHPYEWEIEKFMPQEYHLQEVELVFPKPLEETPFVMVNEEEQLKEMLEELRKEKEIAIDLEHHSYRTFQGFSCLMQISTREKDYIVDVLKLRSELYILNEVLTDPKIVKVLHGADSDILWLQRDFGLYIVNLFDTGQAARVLEMAHKSLSHLVKHYCKLDMDKKFQLADWRIRPLPVEMIKYAREDTHYLLYIYDCMKTDLLKRGNKMKNLLLSTYERSKLICLQKYQKPVFREDKYLELYRKSKKILNAKQLYCFKELYSWRDRIARENDESYNYVLPNHMLLQIAETLPREQQGILACCNPVPPLVKQQLNELHSIILKVNETSMKQLESLELQQKAQAPNLYNSVDLSSLVHCPHDILHLEDTKMQMNESSTSETVLPHISKSHSSSSLLKKKPSLSALFVNNSLKEVKPGIESVQKIPQKVVEQIKKLISPYERFKMTEELHSSQKNKIGSEQRVNQNQEAKQPEEEIETVEDDSCITIEDPDNEVEVIEENATANTSTADVIMESTPIRKKKNKNRRKRKLQPDISVVVPAEEDSVQEAGSSFTPYEYNQSDLNKFTENKASSKKFKKNKNNQNQKPYFGKNRKHFKQTTFSTDSTKGLK